jgi:hypothetical protein
MADEKDRIQRRASFRSVLQRLEIFGGVFLVLLGLFAAGIRPRPECHGCSS